MSLSIISRVCNMKGNSLILILILIAKSDESNTDDENDNDTDNPETSMVVPPHTFVFKEHKWTRGMKVGQVSHFVTLHAPPYQYTRKTNTIDDGIVTFICKGCRRLGKHGQW